MFIAAMILFMSLLKHSNGNRDHKTKRNEPTVISYIVLSTLILSAFLFRMDILKAILTLVIRYVRDSFICDIHESHYLKYLTSHIIRRLLVKTIMFGT